MKAHPLLTRLLFHARMLLWIAIATLLQQGCSRNEQPANERVSDAGWRTQGINLFPEQSVIYDNTGKLNYDQAFARSTLVLHTDHIEKIDSSATRSVKTIYLYKADAFTIEKPATEVKSVGRKKQKEKKQPSILFLSNEPLFADRTLKDSVYLFLRPLQGYNILQNRLGIHLQWLPDAPFEVNYAHDSNHASALKETH